MIDLHAHVLPGLDDGPATLDEALVLLREMAASGVTAVAATPHVRDDFPTTPAQAVDALARVRAAVEAEGLAIEVLSGGELALEHVRYGVEPEAQAAFALGGNPLHLLVEFPYHSWPLDLPDVVSALVHSGVRPVLAHPERNPVVQEDPARIGPLVAGGALVQLTAASLAAPPRSRTRRTALTLLERGHAHLAASDAHGAAARRPGLASVRESLRDEELADWLTRAVPGAIVRGEELPAPPAGGGRRGRGLADRLLRRR